MARNNLRQELGDEWEEYQRVRQNLKALRYKLRNVDAVINWRIRTKKKLIDYKGGKCQNCGFDKNIPAAYDFHHRDPTAKDFRISGRCLSWDKLVKEVDKCNLLCRICHAQEHEVDYSPDRKKAIASLTKRIKDLEGRMKKFQNAG